MVGLNIQGQLNALNLLKKNVQTLIRCVKETPAVRENPAFMRKLSSICRRIPVMTETDDFSNEYSESMILSHLALMNKAIS
jgi:hypothetical protein